MPPPPPPLAGHVGLHRRPHLAAALGEDDDDARAAEAERRRPSQELSPSCTCARVIGAGTHVRERWLLSTATACSLRPHRSIAAPPSRARVVVCSDLRELAVAMCAAARLAP